MIDWTVFPLFLAGALALAVTPGPDMAFVLATSASKGGRAGLVAASGVAAGSLFWILASTAGLTALLAASEHALLVVRWVGGAYLIYLAIQAMRHLGDAPKGRPAGTLSAAFRRGLMTNLLNPKVGLFFIAFLPQFTNPDIGPAWLQIITLGVLFSAMGTSVLIVVAFSAGAVRERLLTSLTWRRVLNGIAATAFGALGLRLIWSRDAV